MALELRTNVQIRSLMTYLTWLLQLVQGLRQGQDKVEAIKTRALVEIMDDDQGQTQEGALDETEATGAEGGAAAELQPPPPLGMKKKQKSFKKQCPSADILPASERV